MSQIVPGQRWISDSEPELGLGVVLQVADRRVRIYFPAGGEVRDYAREGAPLTRVRFRVGDRVWGADHAPMIVDAVDERDGRLVYRGEGRELHEHDLSDQISFSRPADRLAAGRPGESHLFDLRADALTLRSEIRRSPARGMAGGRSELIPHQLFIAGEVADRWAPRVLLSDEVGLGKTIEAGLILHRLLVTGRIRRVLVVVPDPLVNQWYLELLRRFNLAFAIFDEDRCVSIEAGDPGGNPFLDEQWILCGLGLLAGEGNRGGQAAAAGWDMLVVDEAHHLGWSRTAPPSREYRTVERLAAHTEGLLLLTATPEQLGEESHFARLRLLDPDRYPDYHAFLQDTLRFRDVARVAARLASGDALSAPDETAVRTLLSEDDADVVDWLQRANAGDREARDRLLRELLDHHGPGRVVFRNTRASVGGFPGRKARLIALESPDADRLARLAREAALDRDGEDPGDADLALERDPRLLWLATLLKEDPVRKVLVIGRRRGKMLQVYEALRRRAGSRIALFHEAMTLLERDRQAAWFAEPDGAQALVCSEIGGEGRNFQFAHDLVLLDLPLDPERLEQRIGRLDRIGQTRTVCIHVPYVIGSPQEVHALWYHEGIHALEAPLPGGRACHERLGPRVDRLAQAWPELAGTNPGRRALQHLLDDSRREALALAVQLHAGRDRLLELSSFRPEGAAMRVEAVRRFDQDHRLETFLLRVFDHYGIEAEEMSHRSYLLRPGHLVTDAFPAIPAEGTTVTADRRYAVTREDLGFLSWDHPLVAGAMDLLLGSADGNCAFAYLESDEPEVWWLEAWFVLEPVAPGRLHADRFLPPTPIRVVADAQGRDHGRELPRDAARSHLVDRSRDARLQDPAAAGQWIPILLDAARTLARRQAPTLIADALRDMQTQLDAEQHRLEVLRRRHGAVRPEEIHAVQSHRRALTAALADAPLRLDALRLIRRGPPYTRISQ
jgi:ATP-dependent helicase HepA